VLETISAEFKTKPAAYWVSRLDEADVPVSTVNSMDGVFADPQIRHRRMRETVSTTDGPSVDVVANPIRFSDTPIEGYTAPPRLGEHTIEVLTTVLGKTPAEIQKLQASKAI
jgi:crotonobetainyl-CoA:carnitine CoA-transferase CaiB-like acyl-CoA transferase